MNQVGGKDWYQNKMIRSTPEKLLLPGKLRKLRRIMLKRKMPQIRSKVLSRKVRKPARVAVILQVLILLKPKTFKNKPKKLQLMPKRSLIIKLNKQLRLLVWPRMLLNLLVKIVPLMQPK